MRKNIFIEKPCGRKPLEKRNGSQIYAFVKGHRMK
jgi:hypothetical protein